MQVSVLASEAPPLSGGRRAWTVGVMCTSVGLVMAMVTIINIALPSMASETGVTQAQQAWIVDVYTLVLAALVLPAGALGDRYGRRGVLIIGLAIFAVSCATPLFADSAGWLVAARGVTGLGAALVLPATLSIINASFPEGQRGRAVGLWAGVAGISAMIGLVLAGLLLQHFSWHSVFLGPAVLSAVLAVAARTVPSSREYRPHPFDLPGAALSTLSIGALVFGILRAAEHGWGDVFVIAALVAACVLGGFFAWAETRRTDPLLDVRLFANRAFATGSLSMTLQFTAAYGGIFVLVQYLQLILGYQPLKAGLALWPLAVTMLPLSVVSATIAKKLGLRPLTVGGLLAVAAGMYLFSVLQPDSGYVRFAIAAAVLGLGLGLTAPASTSAILDNVPPDKYGVASAVNDATREIGAALGIALAGSILSAAYGHAIAPAAAALPAPVRDVASGSLAGTLGVAQQSGPAGAALAKAGESAFTDGMWPSLLTLAAVVAAGAVATVFLGPRSADDR
ncbi:MFS transporter [Amycolatopsis sp. K13G38]|uniref:MFS transporter n=1 Tax=Amycolatopsis acididurans TaxID=2724524 RepID=A0ABX1JET6_9PSEU|nr:MFS transporter [Amycolatopsis acididurans]NKQ58133.1 MFS transporter [Amycolatopsis acididurans]